MRKIIKKIAAVMLSVLMITQASLLAVAADDDTWPETGYTVGAVWDEKIEKEAHDTLGMSETSPQTSDVGVALHWGLLYMVSIVCFLMLAAAFVGARRAAQIRKQK